MCGRVLSGHVLTGPSRVEALTCIVMLIGDPISESGHEIDNF